MHDPFGNESSSFLEKRGVIEKRGLIEIGLRSWNLLGDLCLGIDVMNDSFQVAGKTPADSDELNVWVRGWDSSKANSLTSRTGISWGVVATLQRMLASSCWTSIRLTVEGIGPGRSVSSVTAAKWA